jgi:putative redox protein
MGKPPVTATLTWQGDLRFEAESAGKTLLLDGDSKVGASPVQMLAFSIAGCMATDVVDIVRKGRHEVRAMEAHFSGDRAQDHPHRLVTVHLNFVIHGSPPKEAVERAIALSHDKYCSVSNSLRTDIAFSTSYEVVP